MTTVKLADVAKYANVSLATASNVINGTRPVSKEAYAKVMQAIEILNYKPVKSIKKYNQNTESTIGVVLTSTDHVFFADVISGIERMADKAGYTVAIYSSGGSLDKEKQLIKYLAERDVKGIILNSCCKTGDTSYVQMLSNLSYNGRHIPVISVGLNLAEQGVSSIYVDGYRSAYLATEYLLKKQCDKVACITGSKYDDVSRERYRGYVEALHNFGIEVDDRYVVHGDFSSYSGYRAFKRMLVNGNKPDSIFCFNDQMAIGAMKAANEYRLKCPTDIKIIGYDNIFVASVVMPQLTTINIPRFQMGQEAFNLLVEEQEYGNNQYETKKIELLGDLIVRQSTDIDAIFSTWDLERW